LKNDAVVLLVSCVYHTELLNILIADHHQLLRSLSRCTRLLQCLFHTLKSFKQEVTSEKLRISASQHSVALELLQKLVTDKQHYRNE